MSWQPRTGSAWHKSALSGRPFLAFGVPRYGFNTPRHAIVFFETGRGCREINTLSPFDVHWWMPLEEAPDEGSTVDALHRVGDAVRADRLGSANAAHDGCPVHHRAVDNS